jgi:chaperonin GroEL
MEVHLNDAYVLLSEKKISSMKDMVPILEQIGQDKETPSDYS